LINMLLSGNSSKTTKAIHATMVDLFATTDDAFILPTLTMRAGETRTVDVELKNIEHDYTALQCEIILPEGLVLTGVEGIDRGAGHNFFKRASEVEENVYSIMGAAMDLSTFAGNEGNVMRLTVKANEDFTAQDAELTLTNVVLVTNTSTAYMASDAMTTFNDASGIENVAADKEIAGVRYINVAGQESEVPFDGVNIVVTTYTDGTSTTVKVIK